MATRMKPRGSEAASATVRKLQFIRGPELDRTRKKKNSTSANRRKKLKEEHRKGLILHAMEDETFKLPADINKSKDEVKISRLARLKMAVQDFAVKSKTGFYVDIFQILVSLVATFVYIAEQFMLQASDKFPFYIILVECFFAFLFSFDFLLHWFIADSRIQHIFSFDAIIDFLSIIPIMGILDETSDVRHVMFFRAFRIFRVFRILRLVGKTSRTISSDVTRSKVRQQMYLIMFLFYSFFFMGAALVHAMEIAIPGSFNRPGILDICPIDELTLLNRWEWPDNCHFTFVHGLYFLMTTLTTIGYGDIHPNNSWAYALTFALMGTLSVTVPPEIQIWQEMQAMASNYSGLFDNASRSPHVIVCGDIATNAALRFLKEFFHVDHGAVDDVVVFLCHYEPDASLASALADHFYESRVKYIKGSVLVESDLKRCQFMNAKAVFVMSNQTSDDPAASDSCSILAIKAMKDIRPTKLPIYCQLLSVESKNHKGWAKWDYLICMEEFEAAVLARNVVCPGFSTMITNLMKSSGDWEVGDKDTTAWMKEYIYGYGQEIYCVNFSGYFLNQPFEKASAELFREFGVCLFAVSVPADRIERHLGETVDASIPMMTLVNPRGYYIRSGDQAFVIADDFEDAEIVNFWNGQKEMDEDKDEFKPPISKISLGVNAKVLQLSPSKLVKKEEKSVIASRLRKMSNAAANSPIRLSSKHEMEEKIEEMRLNDDGQNEEETKQELAATDVVVSAVDKTGEDPDADAAKSELESHCIVVGSMAGIRGFLSVLRFFSNIPVLLLDDHPDNVRTITECCRDFPDVHFLEGNGLSTQLLLNAGIEKAHCCVVRTDPLRKGVKTLRVGANIRDTATIFTACIIEQEFSCRVVAEMLDEQAMAFLKHRPTSDDPSSAWPQYCSGQVYVCDIDAVLCNIYYNETVMELLTRLIYSTDLDKILHPDSDYKKHSFRECDALVQIKVPKEFDHRQYHHFYSYMLTKFHILPLGVYRSPFKHTSPLPYIVTNPKPEMELSRHDRVFVLCDPRSCQGGIKKQAL
jgi:voltage-gated potassium channel